MKLLLLLLSGAKLGKLALSGGSMLLSLVTYGWLFGWRYAGGFIALLLVHEMGHYIAARRRGLPVGLPTFIPFVGAWIDLKAQPRDAETEAYVGLGGPLLGTLGALACYAYANAQHLPWLLAVAYAGFMLNLFNLIPLSPLDGGRITAVLGPRVWLVGVPVLVALFVYRPSPLLILLGVAAAPQVMRALKGVQGEAERAYYATASRVKLEYGLHYLLLVAFLALMSQETHGALRSAAAAGLGT